jgi:hypothetical protein
MEVKWTLGVTHSDQHFIILLFEDVLCIWLTDETNIQVNVSYPSEIILHLQ